MSDTPSPTFGPAGAALWADLNDVVSFDAHETALLIEACRVRDRLDALDEVVRAQGVTTTTPQGVVAHPALKEARAQELTLARLLASIRIPDESSLRPQHRGSARGTYRRA